MLIIMEIGLRNEAFPVGRGKSFDNDMFKQARSEKCKVIQRQVLYLGLLELKLNQFNLG